MGKKEWRKIVEKRRKKLKERKRDEGGKMNERVKKKCGSLLKSKKLTFFGLPCKVLRQRNPSNSIIMVLQPFDLLRQQCQGRLALGSSVSSSPETVNIYNLKWIWSQISIGFVQIFPSLCDLLMKASVRTNNYLSKVRNSIQHENIAIENWKNLKGQIRIGQKPAIPLVFFFSAVVFLHFPEEEENISSYLKIFEYCCTNLTQWNYVKKMLGQLQNIVI